MQDNHLEVPELVAEPVSAMRPRSPYSPYRGLPWLLGLLAGLMVLLAVPYLAEQIQYSITRGREKAKAEVARELLDQLPEAASRYAAVTKAIEPSVVGVETVQVLAQRRPADEWSYMFRGQQQLRAEGEGSGVIMDSSGYILTNYHVIGRADQVTVKLSDGRTVSDVKVVGADPLSDLAVLKIDAPDLQAAEWGDSDDLEVGDPVLAVGNPFRLAHTVTAGIISAKGRRGVVQNVTYQDFLQTDAAVNPGNSGGPLVDMSARVVGINTAIYGDRYQGISFAIPSRIARQVYEKIKATGTVARGWLGVELQQVTDTLATRLGLKDARGALVTHVLPDSPASAAGLQTGDVVVKWDGEEIGDMTDLSLAVARTDIGSKVKVELVRDGEPMELTVTVGQRPTQLSR